MSRRQQVFDSMFLNQSFGPRNGFKERDWQVECATDYGASIADWEESHQGNGDGEQHRFCIYAGTGSGKTKTAGCLASYVLNTKKVGQVVVVVPNRSILRKTRAVFRESFGVDLVAFKTAKYGDGIPRTKQGYILTYAHLIKNPDLHRRICSPERTLVIFDEIHHLGDRNGWGDAATQAFGGCPFIISLTGTPYRSDNTRIPFVTYEECEVNGLIRFRADHPFGYTYRLGRAVADGVCRKPCFHFFDAKVLVRTSPDGPQLVTTFDPNEFVSDNVSSLRLRGAVKYGSTDRRTMLAQALSKCRDEHRKVIIFLGGDTEGDQTPTMDATELLPVELQELGVGPDEYEIITGDDNEALEKIDQFGRSNKWVLVSINMVSEGTDIPEISAAIFLTSITAKQTTVQRIGRCLRMMGPDDPITGALIFMFRDENFRILADEIEDEIRQEIDINKRRRDSEGTGQVQSEEHPYRAEAIGIGDAPLVMVKFHGREWPGKVFEAAQQRLRTEGLPGTMLETAMSLLLMEKGDVHG